MYPKDDYEFTYGDWRKISAEPDCDVLEVNCSRKNESSFRYSTLHTQIFRR